MRSPAYHLRPNKAADRFALLEAIRRLPLLGDGGLEKYTYFSLGGPYLEDFRLLYEYCPEMRMVSIESDEEVYKRQKFNRPFRSLKLVEDNMTSYISRYDPGDKKSVFWLDYTGLDYRCFQDLMSLLEIVAPNSMIKITLRSEPKDYWILSRPNRPKLKKKQAERFRKKFETVMPDASVNPPKVQGELALLLQEMLQIASQKVLPPRASGRSFIPVSSFYYSDGKGMFTLTGIVCNVDKTESVRQAYRDWEFANLDWDAPTKISVPVLSTMERLHLQRLLPTRTRPGSRLRKRLGYLIEDDCNQTEEALEQYAAFHRYSPYFVRGVP